jgi:hypothetical protein
MSLLDKDSVLGPTTGNRVKNPLEDNLVDKQSFLTPLKFLKYDSSNIRAIGGSRQSINVTTPAPEPPTPVYHSFSNAFSNAFNL